MIKIGEKSFNTDNGIRRATIDSLGARGSCCCQFQYRQRYQEGYNPINFWLFKQTDMSFQYRQRYQEGYNTRYVLYIKFVEKEGFNTDNGIRRATIL